MLKKANIHLARGACCLVLALSAAGLSAQPTGDQPPHKPPPEALDACKALKAGQECSFTTPRGAEKGTCFAPEGKSLACRPKNPPGGGRPGESGAPKK